MVIAASQPPMTAATTTGINSRVAGGGRELLPDRGEHDRDQRDGGHTEQNAEQRSPPGRPRRRDPVFQIGVSGERPLPAPDDLVVEGHGGDARSTPFPSHQAAVTEMCSPAVRKVSNGAITSGRPGPVGRSIANGGRWPEPGGPEGEREFTRHEVALGGADAGPVFEHVQVVGRRIAPTDEHQARHPPTAKFGSALGLGRPVHARDVHPSEGNHPPARWASGRARAAN